MYTHNFIVGIVLGPEQLKGITAYITKEVLRLTDSVTCMEDGACWSRPFDPASSWSVKVSASRAERGCTSLTLTLSDEFDTNEFIQQIKNRVSHFDPTTILKPNFIIKPSCPLSDPERAAFFSAFLQNYSLFMAFSTSRFINSYNISSEDGEIAIMTFTENGVQIKMRASIFDSGGYPPNQKDLESLLQAVAPRAFRHNVPPVLKQTEPDLHSFVYSTPQDQPHTIFPEYIGAFLLDSKKLFGPEAVQKGSIERILHAHGRVADYFLVLPDQTKLMGVRYFSPRNPVIVTINVGLVVEETAVKPAEAADSSVPGKKTLLQNKFTANLNRLLDISVESQESTVTSPIVTVKSNTALGRFDDLIDLVSSLGSRWRRRSVPTAKNPEPRRKAVSS